ncbi:MAG: hypothetical protein ACJA2W_002018 [Planctomycetota bacterium]|jgi:hypothetical protein
MSRGDWDESGWRGRVASAPGQPKSGEGQPGPFAPGEGGRAAWVSLLPLALLVLAGTALGGLTLIRILGHLGEDRAADLVIPASRGAERIDALAAIETPYLGRWIEILSSVEFGGRDTPSRGLDLAQERVAKEFQAIGLAPAYAVSGPGGSAGAPLNQLLSQPLSRPLGERALRPYLRTFRADAAFFGRVPYEAPDPGACALVLEEDGEFIPLEFGVDYVPLVRSSDEDPVFAGVANSDLVFAGFGIDSTSAGYDDFAAVDVKGKVALILDGEPGGAAFAGRFLDEEVSAEACIWNKLDALAREGAVGALVVDMSTASSAGPSAGSSAGGQPLEYRWTRAYWNPPTMDQVRGGLPTLRLSVQAAEALLGESPVVKQDAILAAGAPLGLGPVAGRRVQMSSGTQTAAVELRNVVGMIPGDPDRPFIVIGAHLDHIGVGPRGRVGAGADDNASGVAAMLGIARALVSTDGRQRLAGMGVVFCAFTGEEDGRTGSEALAQDLPLPKERCAGMINLDMIGRGAEASAAVLGLVECPEMRRPLERALAAGDHGLERLQEVTSASFFQRSDHYSFYKVGIPSLFLFEDWPHQPGIYHTWRDRPEGVSVSKVASVSRLAALVAFELAR